MKQFYALVWIILLFSAFSALPTTINGRFTVVNITPTKYTIRLQINTNTGIDDLGGATFVVGFDTNLIKISNSPIKGIDYSFYNFDGGHYSAASITRPKKNQIWVNIHLPFSNNNSGTIVAGYPGWTNVVSITFNRVNPNIQPSLYWYSSSSFWGIYDANNSTLWANGDFDGNFGLTVAINDGWNSVSVPGINPNGQGVNNWWTRRNQEYNVYRFVGGSYVTVTNTNPGEGYWMFHEEANIYNTGDEWPAGGIQRVPNEPINVTTGWNLIGGFENIVQSNQIATSPPGLITGPIYSFTDQYQIANIIEPGRGYLLKVNGPGQIIFTTAQNKSNGEEKEYFHDSWGRITFTDASNRIFSLHLVKEDVDLNLYDLPPTPPEKLFDIRFGSGRTAENLKNGIQSIEMKGITYPVKVVVENIDLILQDESARIVNASFNSGHEITITDESISKLFVIPSNSLAPVDYYLEQNYPNPFNPTTKIKFALKKDSYAELKIYNILGELISTLVDEQLNTGYYEHEFNASNLASGIYIYQLKAGDFVETRKMVLTK